MENTTVSKSSVSYGLALAVTCIVNALIVVVKEKSDAVMNSMKQVTGHHWITHSVFVVVLFVLLAFVFGRANNGQGVKITGSKLLSTLITGVVTAGLIIIGFYLILD